ncbi:MAG: hypothetical protein IKY52_08200, partial [Clostridia bacterium]|nr:hypothetical protein [Clostridia bacterium]
LMIDEGKKEYLFYNLAMIHALIMFVGIFGTANYFGRLANYFLPMIVVVLPWIMKKIYYRHQLFVKSCCVIGYIVYFYFDNVVFRHFDAEFSRITIFEYLSSHF